VTDADATLANARSQSALQTSNQFIQTLQTADLVRVQQDAIRRAEDKLAIANAKLATRAATIKEVKAPGKADRGRPGDRPGGS
jgi:outer membrane protein TolC